MQQLTRKRECSGKIRGPFISKKVSLERRIVPAGKNLVIHAQETHLVLQKAQFMIGNHRIKHKRTKSFNTVCLPTMGIPAGTYPVALIKGGKRFLLGRITILPSATCHT